jgi:excisionase family DNA binding protein
MASAPRQPLETERLLCPREVADATRLSYHAVLRAIHRGELRAFRLCQRIRLRPSDVQEWIDANRVAAGANSRSSPLFSAAPQAQRGSLAALRALEEQGEDR